MFCPVRFKTTVLHFKDLPVFGEKQKTFQRKHHSRLRTLIHMFLVEYKSIHKNVGAIYSTRACSMMDVFVDSCKETAYGHHLRSFAQSIFCR